MLICPNKNLKEWKDLAASVGENRAMLMWYESEGKVGFTLSAQTTILDNLSKVNSWFKQMKDTDTFWNKLQKDLQIPKDQISLLKESNGKTIEEKLISFVTDYSYTVEINTATKASRFNEHRNHFKIGNDRYWKDGGNDVYYKNDEQISKEDFFTLRESTVEKEPSDFYSNLTVPGGTNYTENEIATPLITPSIKGHAQFATDKGIGWFRSDDKGDVESKRNLTEEEEDLLLEQQQTQGNFNFNKIEEGTFDKSTKTRRILEVQSDIFQKSRDIKSAEDIYNEMKKSGELIVDCG